MPIVKWLCSGCNSEVELDHYETNAACAGVVDPAFAAAVLASDRERHALLPGQKPQVHVTDGLGCPRKTAILWQENVAVDPLKYCAIDRGQAMHERRYKYAPDSPGVFPEWAVGGTLADVPVVGRIDRMHQADSLIIDFKTPNDRGMWERKKGGAKPEDMAQVAMYAELVEQGMGWRPEKGRIWYIFGSGHVGCDFPIQPIEEALALKPYGGEWTVAQLLQMTANLLLAMEAGQKGWHGALLCGESMTFGNADMCSFCAVKPVCWTQAKGAPI